MKLKNLALLAMVPITAMVIASTPDGGNPIHEEIAIPDGGSVYTAAESFANRHADRPINVNELSFKIIEENGISDPGNIAPGTKLIINYGG